MPDVSPNFPQISTLITAILTILGGFTVQIAAQYFRSKSESKHEVISYSTKSVETINAEINNLSGLLAECLRGRDDQVLAALVRIEYKLEKLEEDLDQVKSINTYNRAKRKKATGE